MVFPSCVPWTLEIVLLLSLAAIPQSVRGLASAVASHRRQHQQSVRMPLKGLVHSKSNTRREQQERLISAFDEIVKESDFLVAATTATASNSGVSSGEISSSCRIPALSEDLVIDCYFAESDSTSPTSSSRRNFDDPHLVLSISTIANPTNVNNNGDATAIRPNDFGWIFSKFYDDFGRDKYQGLLDLDNLRQRVVDHHNQQPPHPGYAASTAAYTTLANTCPTAARLFETLEQQLPLLQQQGFIVLDTDYVTTTASHQLLSNYLVETTGDIYRKDKVHFLTRSQAARATLEPQFDLLMSLASFLNQHSATGLAPSHVHNPIAPATIQDPLTIPNDIQLAQYSHGDFYLAHSDNSIAHEQRRHSKHNEIVRNNFRHVTCILYCNDLGEADGGALRIYPNSQHLIRPDEAIHQGFQYVDVVPKNGRLLLFDSCLVHSVQHVTSPQTLRRALTLWINRPNDSGVRGESYF